MRRRWRLKSRAPLLFAFCFLPSLLSASNLSDTARQLAGRIAAITGPGSIGLDMTNRSSLDEKSVREVRIALQGELQGEGVRIVSADQAVGTVTVVLSESLREYVWTAEIAIGADPPRVLLASLPRALAGSPFAAAPPVTLRKTSLFSQQERILDAALIDAAAVPTGVLAAPSPSARLLVLDGTHVAAYRQQSGRWDLEASLPIVVSQPLPRDLRGRLLLRRDRLFDAYLPGTFCRSNATVPLALTCATSDDPWPLNSGLTSDDNGPSAVRAYYAPARNFFTGALSPGLGKISNVPSFYDAAAIPRQGYMLWALAAVDGSAHVIDGVTDQAIHSAHWGSDLAAVRSGCGAGTQLLVSGDAQRAPDHDRDTLRAFEIPDRDPVTVSSALEFDGTITALWPDASGTSALVVVHVHRNNEDSGWYEASRITISCAN